MKNIRLKTIKDELIKKAKCTHVLITDLVDVTYISGFKSSNAALLISNTKNIILSDFRYQSAADIFCKQQPDWKFILVKEHFFSTISKFIPEGSIVGFQSDIMTVDNYNDLKKTLKNVKLLSVSNDISKLYLRKTPDEIKGMKKAAQIGDQALQKLIGKIHQGMTEFEVARKLEQYCGELGSEKPSFDTIVLFGKRAALPHGRPQDIKLKKGDWILIDFGCTVDGLCSDMTRTFVFNKASKQQKELYKIVKDAQEIGRKEAKAGIRSNYLDGVVRSYIKKYGYDKEFGHALGHGVGLRIHERPRVSPYVDEVLEENCIVTIEPGIYNPDIGGVRIEDMMVLHEDGAKELTNFPRELIIV